MKHSIILIVIAATGLTLNACGEPNRDDPQRESLGEAQARAKPQAGQRAVSHEAIDTSLAAAEEYFHTRDLAKAQAILLRLLDRAPDEPRALELHGQLLMAKAAEARDKGDHARAKRFFSDAYERYRALLEIEPASAGLQQSAGEVAQVAGRDDDALIHYNHARRLNPRDPKPPFFAAQVHIERGEYDAAAEALREVLAIDPDEPLAHASLANIAVQQRRFDDALEHIIEAREIRPSDESFRVIEASIHRKSGDPQAAVELLIALNANQRSRWFVAEELAKACSEMGEHRRAAGVWAHVHRSNPRAARAPLAAVRAGEAMLQAGEREQAWMWLEEARLTAPDAPETEALARLFSRTDAADSRP